MDKPISNNNKPANNNKDENANAANSQQKKVVDLNNINSAKATNVISKASGKRQILINSPETNLEGVYAYDIEKSSGRSEIENEDNKSSLQSYENKKADAYKRLNADKSLNADESEEI